MRTRLYLSLSVVAALWMTACSPERQSHSRHVADMSSSLVHRAVYRFSVVAGGVYSDEELRRIRGLDRVVAEHYAPIGSHAVATSLPREASMYVSYRVQDKIYWTASKRHIPKGEHVLSDGANLVRTRCGNRLSPVPMTPTRGGEEPPDSALEAPEPPSDASKLGPPEVAFSYPEPVPTSYSASAPTPFDGDVFASSLPYSSFLILPPNSNLQMGNSPMTNSGFEAFNDAALLGRFGGVGIGPGIGPTVPPAALVSIPEPAEWLLFLGGTILLGGLVRFSRYLPSIM